MLLKFKFVHVFLVALFISCSGNWVCGQTPLSAWDSFPPLYFIEVNRVKYSVIKTSEAKILGMRGSRGFLDPEGRPVTDPGVIKKLVKTSWVWENIIQPSSIPLNFHGLEKPEKRIPIIRGVLDTYKDVKIYEITQDLIVRTFINVSVVIVAGPTSTSSLIKTMGKLTVGNLIDTLSSGASLKNVLGAVSVVSLWDALAKYSSIQSEIERLGSLTINYDIANRIYELYVDAYVRDLPNEALLVSIMPKRWKDLVMQALKTAGSETLSFVFPYHSSMSSIERAQLVDTAHLIKCVDFLYDRIGSLPNFERVGESKRNTKTSVGLFEKTMMELEKQWVSQFKSPIQIIAPQIATISPPQVQAGQFTLTINGSNFDSGAIDQVYNPSGQLIGSGAQSGGLVSRSSNQIVVRENLTGAPAGTYTVKVKNSDGKLSNPINIVVTSAATGCVATVSSDRWRGEYFANKSLSGSPLMVRDDGTGFLPFDWGTGSPGSSCGIPSDNFSVRWTRAVYFEAGTYRFSVTADDGVRFYVDGSLKLDKWFDQPATTHTVDVSLSAGSRTLRMEYYEGGGQAVAKLSWQKTTTTQPPVSPTISMSPLSGVVGTTFTQKGSGFTQNRTATIWGRDSGGNVARIGTINTDSTGSFTSTWIAQTPGNNLARWAVDDATGKKSNEIVFNVTSTQPPATQLSPAVIDAYNRAGGTPTFGESLPQNYTTPSGAASTNTPYKAVELARGGIYEYSRGVFVVYGAIYTKYRPIGGPRHYLGLPTSNEGDAARSPQGTTGRFSRFERGGINWLKEKNQTYLVQGAIFDKWASLGYSGGQLGFPVSDEYPYQGGARSDFEGGHITWTSQTGAQVVYKTAPVITPQIASISPPQVQAGQFTLTINGSNFDSGAIDQVYNPSGQLIGSGAQSGGLVSRSSNQIVVRENLTGAPAGTYTVKVKNSDGKLSNPINIVVTSVVQLTPTLTQTPASGPVGTTFTQKGSGFTQNRTATIWGRDSVGNVARIGTINTDSTGSFTSTWIAQTPGNNLARWAVDDATGKKSNEIVFNVTAAIISDTRPPNVTSFSASASQITQGQSVTLSYSVTDDVGLKQVELWRADDTAGVNFREIKRVTVSGTSYSGSFSDAPPVPGTYRYGIHVVDMANKWNCERNSQSGGSPGVYGPRQVVVVSATPTISRPSPPTPVSPGSPNEPGTVINTLTPTLQWTAVPNAEYYALAISAYPYGTVNIVYNPQKIYGTSIIVPSGVLVKGKKYRWNMQAYNSAGWSSVSTTLYFQIP